MATKFPPPSPPFIPARRKGGRQVPKAIVLHGTVSSDNAGTARRIALWWNGPTSPMSSAHYTVDPREVIQSVGDHTVAFHCGFNTGSIGVEFCDEQQGPASRWNDADSNAILRRAATLVAQLCLAYGIAPNRPSITDLKRKGPHGIYGHNDSRLAFGHTTHTDPRDFPWAKFLGMVRSEIKRIKRAARPSIPGVKKPVKPKPEHPVMNVAHWSAQYSDTPAQQRADANKVFMRAAQRKVRWITGTEAQVPSLVTALTTAANKHGYALVRRGELWVAVNKSLIKGKIEVDYEVVVKGKSGKFPNRGVLAVSFFSSHGIGATTVIASHYQTKTWSKNTPEDNRRLADTIGDLARKHGQGKALVFYGGDQNIDDDRADTFKGAPLTSVGDELKKWPGTHGANPIDVIASYDPDTRVKAAYLTVLTDKTFPLHGDHNLVEAGFEVRRLVD